MGVEKLFGATDGIQLGMKDLQIGIGYTEGVAAALFNEKERFK